MDHIVSAPATPPLTQVGHTALTVVEDKRMNIIVIVIVYVNNSTAGKRKKLGFLCPPLSQHQNIWA
jgi:hypothetical protein